MPTDGSPRARGLRDSAMIRLMSDCLLRISEIVAVNVEDFEKQTLILRQSKTDPEGAEAALYVTADTRRVVKRYLKRAEIVEGAVFRRIRRGGHIGQERLTDFSARRIIQQRAKAAGVDGFIAGHSLRVGSAVSLAQAGASVTSQLSQHEEKKTRAALCGVGASMSFCVFLRCYLARLDVAADCRFRQFCNVTGNVGGSRTDRPLLLDRFYFLCEGFNLLFESAVSSAAPGHDDLWGTNSNDDQSDQSDNVFIQNIKFASHIGDFNF